MTATVRRKRVKWTYGDVFAVPLCDGSYGVCQAAYEVFTHVADCAFFALRFTQIPAQVPALQPEDVISLAATWKNSLKNGAWPKMGCAPLVLPRSAFPNQRLLQEADGVGVKHYDEGLIEEFLSAWHGLYPWNVYFREDYLDTLLAPGVTRPGTALILDSSARDEWREREKREREAKRTVKTARTARRRRETPRGN